MIYLKTWQDVLEWYFQGETFQSVFQRTPADNIAADMVSQSNSQDIALPDIDLRKCLIEEYETFKLHRLFE